MFLATFSCSDSIGLQIWDWHQGGCSLDEDGCSGIPCTTVCLGKWRLPLPILSNLQSSSTCLSPSSDSTTSCNKNQYQWEMYNPSRCTVRNVKFQKENIRLLLKTNEIIVAIKEIAPFLIIIPISSISLTQQSIGLPVSLTMFLQYWPQRLPHHLA